MNDEIVMRTASVIAGSICGSVLGGLLSLLFLYLLYNFAMKGK